MRIVTVMLLLIANTGLAQQITFQKYFGTVQLYSYGHGILQMEDSGFVIGARRPSNFYLIRTDKYGDTIWVKTPLPTNVEKIIRTKDGGFAIVGGGFLLGQHLIITDINGDTLWTKLYPGNERGYDLCQTSDSGYVIATEGSFFKVDKNGNFMWDVYMCYCNAVKEAPNGDIIATGSTCNGPDYYTVDRVSSTGQVIWNRTYGNINDNSQWYGGSDLQIAPDNNILVVCDDYYGGWDLMKIDFAAGDTLFTKNFNVLSVFTENAPLAYMNDSNLITFRNPEFVKFDQSGNMIWNTTATFEPYELTGCSDGGLAATGIYYPSPPVWNSQVVYAKYDSTGNVYNFQGVNNLYSYSEAWVCPNPVTTTATLQFKNAQRQNVTLTIYDVLGNEVIRKETTGNSFTINASALKSGMYFYTVTINSVMYNGKFVVE